MVVALFHHTPIHTSTSNLFSISSLDNFYQIPNKYPPYPPIYTEKDIYNIGCDKAEEKKGHKQVLIQISFRAILMALCLESHVRKPKLKSVKIRYVNRFYATNNKFLATEIWPEIPKN